MRACYSRTDRAAAIKKPSVVNSPTILPPCLNASGIIVSASIVNIAPVASLDHTAVNGGD